MTHTLDNPVDVLGDLDELFDNADLWAVIVWNDDVNTFEHVIRALVEILQHTTGQAERLAMRVHTTGKAVVAVRPKAEAEAAVQALHRRKIQASMDLA